jgi:hypothetical protein
MIFALLAALGFTGSAVAAGAAGLAATFAGNI